MIEVKLAQFGMGMKDATITKWFYQVGDTVKEGEPIAEGEAAKATIEIVAPASGVLTEIRVQEEELAKVRDVLATIAEA